MSSTFAVGGLASGLDTKSIIDQLMQLEQRPLKLVQGRQTAHTSKMAAVQSVKDQISSLMGMISSLADRSKMNAKVASTDTPGTSPTVLSASANADAINSSFKVTVSQLASSTRVASTAPLGNVIDANATLATAGFRYSVTQGTFRINGKAITVDGTTTLNSLVASINSTPGIGVTATLVADADGRANNRVQLVADPGGSIQLGSIGDTSNALRLLNLSDAVVTAATAASTNSGIPAAAGALATSVTINGEVTAINQADGTYTAAQNAAFIAQQINNNSNNTVTAAAQADGTITLTQKTKGTAASITASGVGTGLNASGVQNGTDEKVVSTTNLGVVDISASLTSARMVTPIAGLDVGGNGKFKINDVEIAYKDTDSITSIINRINASTAGVTAFYDPVQDRLRLSSSQTGARTITLEESQGNFLAATGVLNATQQLGQNALFSIDTVNGGAQLSSSTNSVTGYVPGVTLDLKSVSTTPVTVTVAQDPSTTVNTIKMFVGQFNSTLTKLDDLTKYDQAKKTASALTGDSGIRDIQQKLRRMVSSPAVGATGAYRNLASIGVSFGAIGAAVGTTGKLTVDEVKLNKALAENPQAVEAVLAGFAATLGAPTTTNIAGVSGTPQIHQDGTYHVKVTDAATGAVEAKFVTPDGRTVWTGTGTMAAGQDNYAVIPGLKITAAASLTNGAEDTFSISVTNKGVGVMLKDYVDSLLDTTGYFAERKKGDDAINNSYTKRIADMQDRLELRQRSLERKYATLETTMSRLQAQSSQLAAQIAKMNAGGG